MFTNNSNLLLTYLHIIKRLYEYFHWPLLGFNTPIWVNYCKQSHVLFTLFYYPELDHIYIIIKMTTFMKLFKPSLRPKILAMIHVKALPGFLIFNYRITNIIIVIHL